MIVYLHADGLSDTGATYGRHLGRAGAEIHQIIVPEDTPPSGLRAVVTRSFERTPRSLDPASIEMLMINSHGSPGTLHLGGILPENSECDITEDNVESLTAIFRPALKPLDQGGEGVEIHGCGVGSASLRQACDSSGCELTDEIEDGEIGYRFIYALARGFNTRVRASASNQIPDFEGLFENTMLEAMPGTDDDWHGHVINASSSSLVHTPSGPGWLEHGAEWTRLGAVFRPPSHRDDPRFWRRDPDFRRDVRRPLY